MPRVVAVLGMHRSGTSMVTALMEILGVNLGGKLGHPSFDNPKGFFEHGPFVEINELALRRVKASWDYIPDVMPNLEGPEFSDLYMSIANCVQEHFAGSDFWAFKDPRCCVTLPMWRRIITDLKESVLIVRHPIEVADSLASRNGISFDRSVDLWRKYVTSSIRHSAGLRRHVVFYEDFLQDLEGELERLRGFLGTPPMTPAQWQRAKDFVEVALRHHRRTKEELEARKDVPAAVSALFRELRAYANLMKKGVVDEGALDLLPRRTA